MSYVSHKIGIQMKKGDDSYEIKWFLVDIYDALH